MTRKLFFFFLAVVFMVSLNGCVATIKKSDESLQNAENKASCLESQLQSKEEEINNLRSALASTEETGNIIRKCAKLGRPNTRQIQTALQNAGFNPGSIDGKMGKQTREAIKFFQSANNLVADGKVGSKTWAVLQKYYDKKTK